MEAAKQGGIWVLVRRWLVTALAVLAGSWLLPGISYERPETLALVVVLLGLLSSFVKPLLVLFALPFVVLTLGVGILFINALLYLLVGRVVGGFEVDGFGSAFLGALIVTLFEVMFRGWIEGTPGVRWKVRVSRGPAGAAGSGGPKGKSTPRQVKAKDDVIDI